MLNKLLTLWAQISTKYAIVGGVIALALFMAFPILMTTSTLSFVGGITFALLVLSND